MDLCLECKGCKAECPANVDMAKIKYEFLHHYYQANGLPLRNRAVRPHRPAQRRWAPACRGSPTGCRALSLDRWLMEKVARHRSAAPAAALRRADVHRLVRRRGTAPAAAPRGEVVLFHDTFVTYNTPEIGRAAVQLLEAAGYRVVLVDRKCCGRPLISKGMLTEAREHAAWNVERLLPYAARGVAIVGLEPSCLLTLRDEYGRPAAHRRGARGGQAERAARAVPAARDASGG